MNLWFILSTTNSSFTSLELSNQFYESGLFSDIDPAFIFDFRTSCTNDTNFGNLWGLNNTLNQNIDINACEAWELTQGEGVNVAIIDQGIDIVHNDLNSNIHPYSFNCQTGTSPSLFLNTGIHGTIVAGIIGAIKDNNLQVVGVAPSSKILAISHPLSTLTLIYQLNLLVV
jgi:subtilisin family serine protease